MSEPKDPGIKLFGRTIPRAVAAAAPACGGVSAAAEAAEEDEAQIQTPNQDQDRNCCGDSAPEDEKNGDLEDKVVDEVCVLWLLDWLFIILSLTQFLNSG